MRETRPFPGVLDNTATKNKMNLVFLKYKLPKINCALNLINFLNHKV